MDSLKKALRQYNIKHPATTLGGHPVKGSEAATQPQSKDALALQHSLAAISVKNEKYFVCGIVMAGVLFVALIVAAFLQISRPNSDLVKFANPLFGTSAVAIVWWMFKTWREKSYTDCILALIPNVDEETLKLIVKALVNRL
jgi:hypothetical protein